MSRTFRRTARYIRLPDYFEWVDRKHCDNTWKRRYVDSVLLKDQEHCKFRQKTRLMLNLLEKNVDASEEVVFPTNRQIFWEEFCIF